MPLDLSTLQNAYDGGQPTADLPGGARPRSAAVRRALTLGVMTAGFGAAAAGAASADVGDTGDVGDLSADVAVVAADRNPDLHSGGAGTAALTSLPPRHLAAVPGDVDDAFLPDSFGDLFDQPAALVPTVPDSVLGDEATRSTLRTVEPDISSPPLTSPFRVQPDPVADTQRNTIAQGLQSGTGTTLPVHVGGDGRGGEQAGRATIPVDRDRTPIEPVVASNDDLPGNAIDEPDAAESNVLLSQNKGKYSDVPKTSPWKFGFNQSCGYIAVGLGGRAAAARSAAEGCIDQFEGGAKSRAQFAADGISSLGARNVSGSFVCQPSGKSILVTTSTAAGLWAAHARGTVGCTATIRWTGIRP